MKQVGPIERTIAAVERMELELRVLKEELAAYLPDDGSHRQDWFRHPVTGTKVTVRRAK